MKKVILSLCLMASLGASAQKLKEYKASNNITYHLGDTVTMANGSGINNGFLYLSRTGFMAAMTYTSKDGGDQLLADRSFASGRGIIEKIKQVKFAGTFRPYFILNFHQGGSYMLQIEEAIQNCEITPCKSSTN